MLAEVVRLDAAGLEVVFEQGVGECLVGEVTAALEGGPGDFADDRAVAVAVRPADNPVIDAGEFLVSVIEALLGYFPATGSMIHRSSVSGPFPANTRSATTRSPSS